MSFVYGVLGGGRQGTAAAYDMARFGDARRVLIADISLEAAQKSAARGVTPRGVYPAELAVSGPKYAAELRRRGFCLTETFTPTIK